MRRDSDIATAAVAVLGFIVLARAFERRHAPMPPPIPGDRAPEGQRTYTPSARDALKKLGLPDWLNPL